GRTARQSGGWQMKLAFSTLGCPAWDLEQIVATAQAAGYEGVEWRGYREEMELPRAAIFTGAARAETRRRFRDAGLQFVSLGSSVRLSDPGPEARRSHREALAAYVELAVFLDCPLVRVFGGKLPNGARREESLPEMAAFLRELAEVAAGSGVAL